MPLVGLLLIHLYIGEPINFMTNIRFPLTLQWVILGEKMTNQNHRNESENSNPGGFIAGMLLGGLAGAGAMLLLAPQAGKKTRNDIQQQGRKLREQTAETIEDGVKQVRDKAHQVTTSIHDQADALQQRGQDVVDQQKERWGPVVEAGKTTVR
jgi:gas vesicle protein